jgi:phosphomannomutase
VLREVLARAGFDPPTVVPEQGAPDPDFPTVAFPNPEEPGALDLALALAAAQDADVVLANDPDADRLAVALPAPGRTGPGGGGWRALTGDEIGVVLADWLLEQDSGPDRLVVTTIVSSSMLGRLAAARGVEHAETLTGFKWLARAGLDRPDLRFVYGYEEALGSCVGTLVRDKDGITAALAFAELVATEKARGRSPLDRLDDLARELGVHATGQRSVRIEGVDGLDRMRAAVDRLAAAPPVVLAGVPVTEVEDLRLGRRLPPTDGVALRGDGVRLIVRPSGTEPKLKCYAEAVVPVTARTDLAAARARGNATMRTILDEAVAVVS